MTIIGRIVLVMIALWALGFWFYPRVTGFLAIAMIIVGVVTAHYAGGKVR